MHQQALDYLANYAHDHWMTAVDLGGRETNGHARWLWPKADWIVVDAVAGPGVDVVADARYYNPGIDVDMVLFAEVAEHFPQWRSIIRNARSLLIPHNDAGLLLVTAAGPGRPEHGINHDDPLQPGWYRNIEPWELEEAFSLARFDEWSVEQLGDDVRGWAEVNGV